MSPLKERPKTGSFISKAYTVWTKHGTFIQWSNNSLYRIAKMDMDTLPKAELHCHLDGIIGPTLARAIIRDDATFPIKPEDFAPYYPIEDTTSFFHWWNVLHPIAGQLRCLNYE